MKRYIVTSGVGTKARTLYYFTDSYRGEPLVNKDTGSQYQFSSEDEAQEFLDTNDYLYHWYPGIRIESRTVYDVWHD